MRAVLPKLAVLLATSLGAVGCTNSGNDQAAAAAGPGLLFRAPPPENIASADLRDQVDVYGRLEFELFTVADNVGRQVPLTEGNLGATFRRFISTSSRRFALTVKPTVNNQVLPEVVLLSLIYDEGAPGGVKSETGKIDIVATNWWRLRSGQAITFQVAARASTQQNFHIADRMRQAVGVLGAIATPVSGGGSAILGALGSNIVGQLASTVDAALTETFSSQPAVAETNSLGPGRTVQTNRFLRQDRYIVRASDGTDLAELRVNLTLARSLADPRPQPRLPELGTEDHPTPPLLPVLQVLVTKMQPPAIAPLQNLINTPYFPELQELRQEATDRRPDPERFDRACARVHNFAQQELGLTVADALRLRWEVLRLGHLPQELRESNCIREAVERWRKMNFPIDQVASLAAPWRGRGAFGDGQDMPNLAQVMLGTGGDATAITARLAERVTIIDQPGGLGAPETMLLDTDAVARDALVGAWIAGKASNVGCWTVPGFNTPGKSAINRLERQVLFLPTNTALGLMVLSIRTPLSAEGQPMGVAQLVVTPAPTTEAFIRERCKDSADRGESLLNALKARGMAPVVIPAPSPLPVVVAPPPTVVATPVAATAPSPQR
jgi:hypothetical protein